jgi:hypothetical protein
MVRTFDIAPADRTAHRPEPDAQLASSVDAHDPAAVGGIAAALERRFGSSLTPGLRCEIARQAIDRYRDARIQTFVTILAQRIAVEIAAQRLRAS